MWRNSRALYRSGKKLLKTNNISAGRRYLSDSNVYSFDDNNNSSENKNIDKFFAPDNVVSWSKLSGAADVAGRIDRLLLFQLMEQFSTDKSIHALCSANGIDGKIFIIVIGAE